MRIERADPEGLVHEVHRIEGIGAAECRSVFLDWALALTPRVDTRAALKWLLAEYAGGAPGHPMTEVLRAGLEDQPGPRRRGGARGRRS